MSNQKQADNTTFTWDRNNSRQVFPIDYSQDAFSKKIMETRYRLKRHPLSHVLVQPLLRGLLFSEKPLPLTEDDSLVPIPLEADLFLICFAKVIAPDQEKITVEQFQKFCEMLRDETDISTTDDTEEIHNTFYRHVLFQNQGFCEAMLVEMWEKEISSRFQKLKDLSRHTPPHLQTDVLVDCLQSLDQCILNLELREKDNASSEQNPTEATTRILEQLLSRRKKIPSSNTISQYSVNNTPVTDTVDMKAAFDILSNAAQIKKMDRANLLAAARKSYLLGLINIEESASAFTFERFYENIRMYLASSKNRIYINDLSKSVFKRCKIHCEKVIDFCTDANKTAEASDYFFPSQPSYNKDLVDMLVDCKMRQHLGYFYETIQIIGFYSGIHSGCIMQRGYLSLCLDINDPSGEIREKIAQKSRKIPEASNLYENKFCRDLRYFSEWFACSWKLIYGDKSPISDNKQMFENKKRIADLLLLDGRTAADTFGRPELAFTSLEEILNLLDQYETLLNNPQYIYSPIKYFEVCKKLMQLLFVMVLRQIIAKVEPVIIEEIKHLSQISEGFMSQ